MMMIMNLHGHIWILPERVKWIYDEYILFQYVWVFLIIELVEILSNESKEPSTLSFAMIYRDKHVYTHILSNGTKHVLSKQKKYQLCCELYEQLLSIEQHEYKRGKWFTRLAMILDYHLKKSKRAYMVCQKGLKDGYVDIAHRNELRKRMIKLHKVCNCMLII